MEKEAKEKLVEEVDKYSSDDEVIALYSAYTRDELERNTYLKEAREEGIQQGIQHEKIKMAKKMLEENMDVSIISKITDLSEKEIEKLR